MKPVYPTKEIIKKFWEKVDKKGENECWLWTGTVNGDSRYSGGYGQFYVDKDRGSVGAHCMAYEIAKGPHQILAHPDWVVGHLCRDFDPTLEADVRSCCNPKHLDLMSRSVDTKRTKANRRKRKPLSPDQVKKALKSCLIDDMHYIEVTDTYFRGRVTTQSMWGIVRGDSHGVLYDQFLKDNGLTREEAVGIVQRQIRERKKRKRK